MWFERYVIIITSLGRASTTRRCGASTRRPGSSSRSSPGSFAFFAMLFLLFLKIFPVIAISEVKELAIHERAHAGPRSPLMPSLQGVFDAPGPVAERREAAAQSRLHRPRDLRAGRVPRARRRARREAEPRARVHAGRRPARRGDRLRDARSGCPNDWPVMIGGKPFAAIPTYTVIGFELTILFGASRDAARPAASSAGCPTAASARATRATTSASPARSSGSSSGCRDRDVAEVDALLRAHHAKEVNLVEA